MAVLTYARYILETALLEYKFNVEVSESKLAAAALVLAFKGKYFLQKKVIVWKMINYQGNLLRRCIQKPIIYYRGGGTGCAIIIDKLAIETSFQ